MDSFASFDSTKKDLQEILAAVAKGDTQLPDFQRSWIWDDDHAFISVPLPHRRSMFTNRQHRGPLQARPVEEWSFRRGRATQLILTTGNALTALFLSCARTSHTKDARTITKRWYITAQALSGNDRGSHLLPPEDRIIRDFAISIRTSYAGVRKCSRSPGLRLQRWVPLQRVLIDKDRRSVRPFEKRCLG